MNVTKMLASLAVVIVSIAVVKPLIAIVSMGVMCLMEARVIDSLYHAFHRDGEHSDNNGCENDIPHARSVSKLSLRQKTRITILASFGRES